MNSTNEVALEQPKRHMKTRTRVLFFLTAWAIVLLPFLFWRSTWFGRPLNDAEITEYLHDNSKPRHIQHALVQIGERITRARAQGVNDSGQWGVAQWYPDVVRLGSHPVEEIRNTDAWIMGQDPARTDFHNALRKLLSDPSMNVRSNAALSLVSFGDASGHDQIVSMLQPAVVTAPTAGQIVNIADPGKAIHQGTTLMLLQNGPHPQEMRAPISGTLTAIKVQLWQKVDKDAQLAVVAPGPEQVWEALRALYVIGTRDDLPLVKSYESKQMDQGEKVGRQAQETEREIARRSR